MGESRPDSRLGGGTRRVGRWPGGGATGRHAPPSPCDAGCGCSGAKPELPLPLPAAPLSGCLEPPSSPCCDCLTFQGGSVLDLKLENLFSVKKTNAVTLNELLGTSVF